MAASLVAVMVLVLVAACLAGKPDLPNVVWHE
jgi:hypothetical protein